jgi:hypothetical protein
MVVCGGIISLLFFRSRQMTEDVDAIFPSNPANRTLLIALIKQAGQELGLSIDDRSLWFNDSVSFFGLQTTSSVVIFNHPFLCLKAAKWEELLAHKVHAFRHDKDIGDAVLLLKQIGDRPKEDVYKDVQRYAPMSPHLPEDARRRNFEEVWKRLHSS